MHPRRTSSASPLIVASLAALLAAPALPGCGGGGGSGQFGQDFEPPDTPPPVVIEQDSPEDMSPRERRAAGLEG